MKRWKAAILAHAFGSYCGMACCVAFAVIARPDSAAATVDRTSLLIWIGAPLFAPPMAWFSVIHSVKEPDAAPFACIMIVGYWLGAILSYLWLSRRSTVTTRGFEVLKASRGQASDAQD
jgi:hypothetical protein